ncbi:HMA2 domain-containing protein [Fortiea contorta]|uniref:HMA2 domain-containing protein n=1 Tax=Fortiea contorta TaxID=1892405 RepID=UPI000349D4F2|nr:hypothetical protein [Fortiea contorta]
MTNNYRYLAKIRHVKEKTSFQTPTKPIPIKIISDTPGRLRLRVAPCDRQSEKMQPIVDKLAAQPGVNQVTTNMQHGSILIDHDDSRENIIATLLDIGIIFGDIAEGNSEAAAGITNAVLDLNQRVQQTTMGSVDLRVLFPLGLSILAFRQLLVKGLQFEVIPWYVLGWYAFDSFMKLNRTSQLNK